MRGGRHHDLARLIGLAKLGEDPDPPDRSIPAAGAQACRRSRDRRGHRLEHGGVRPGGQEADALKGAHL